MNLKPLAEVKIRMERGISLIGFIKNAIYVGAGLKIIFNLNLKLTIIAVFASMIGFWVIGYIDTVYFKFMQQENELASTKYNPQLNKIK